MNQQRGVLTGIVLSIILTAMLWLTVGCAAIGLGPNSADNPLAEPIKVAVCHAACAAAAQEFGPGVISAEEVAALYDTIVAAAQEQPQVIEAVSSLAARAAVSNRIHELLLELGVLPRE